MNTKRTRLSVSLVGALLATSSYAAIDTNPGEAPDPPLTVLAMNHEAGEAKTDDAKSDEIAPSEVDKSQVEMQDKSSLKETQEGAESAVGRTGQAIDDVAISASIKARFVEDPAISADDVNIDTALGVVTLSGTVMSDEAKSHATEVVKSVKGVVSVDNRLVVGSPESIGAKTKDFLDDAVITTKVKALLIGEESLSAAGINVDTAKGVVTLSGTVSSEADKEKAEEIAAKVDGVHTVDNRLTIK